MESPSIYHAAVQRILSQVTASNLEDFGRKKTDYDRMKLILQFDYVHKAFNVQPSYFAKSVHDSKRNRDKGNELYQRHRYETALELYTKSLLQAPVPSEELAIALANRSAVLFNMQHYEPALNDISEALQVGYPEDLRYKLYERRGRCYLELGFLSEAQEALGQVERLLLCSRLSLEKREAWRLNTEHLLQECRVSERRKTENKVFLDAKEQCAKAKKSQSIDRLSAERTLLTKARRGSCDALEDCSANSSSNDPVSASSRESLLDRCMSSKSSTELDHLHSSSIPVYRSRSERFKSASNVYDVKCSSRRGRYSAATKNVPIGSVILSEQPYVWCLSKEFFNTHCYNCMRRFLAPYGCISCSAVRYCSADCHKASWSTHHKFECQYLKLLTDSGIGNIGLLTLRILIQAGLQRIYKVRDLLKKYGNTNDKFTLPVDKKNVYLGGYEGVHQLVSHSDKRSNNDLFQYSILASYLLKILKHTSYFDDANLCTHNMDLDVYIGSTILRFLQVVSCNGIDIMEIHIDSNYLTPVAVGLGLYPTAALLNHNCAPNLELVFYGTTCVAKTIRNVSVGEEFSIDYGYVFYLQNKEQRHFSLKHQYFFDCSCIACVQNWPTREKLLSTIPTLLCTKCAQGFSVELYKQNPKGVQCTKCGSSQKPLEQYEKLQESTRKLNKALGQARLGLHEIAAPILEKYLTQLEKYVQLPYKDHVLCTSGLKQCYRAQGNIFWKKEQKRTTSL